MKITIEYEPTENSYTNIIMIDKIVRMSKSNDGEVTFIHLITGEIVESLTSIMTLNSRLNSAVD